jgi:DNA topoisomerase VI subunit A
LYRLLVGCCDNHHSTRGEVQVYGLEIYSVYKYGSKRASTESHTALPKLQWLGGTEWDARTKSCTCVPLLHALSQRKSNRLVSE